MKTEKLNYELRLFDKKGNDILSLDFHGDSSALAGDHANHVLMSEDKATFCHWRKKGANLWKPISKN